MKLRWKYGLPLAAAAVAFACLTPGASATSFQAATTNTYSAQTVAINGGNVAIPSGATIAGGPIRYQTFSGQFAGTAAGIAGDTIVFTALTAGATFSGAPVAVCTGCPATTSFTTTVSTNAITVTVFSTAIFPPATAVPLGAIITLQDSATVPAAGTFHGPSVTLQGLANLQTVPPTSGTATAGAPTVVLGTASPATGVFPASISVAQVPNVIVGFATCSAGAVICTASPTGDTNPVPVLQLASANSFSFAAGGVTQLVDLTGATTSGCGGAGTCFQVVSGGAATVTPAGFLGTFTLLNSAALLDARFGNQCCNNTSNIFGGNTPLAGTASIVINGDFQTITNAYLRVGPTTSQGQQPVETQPTANGTCTTTTSGSDITSSPLPTAGGGLGAGTTLTFSVPAASNTLPAAGGLGGASFVNTPVYALCVVTNGTNVIADTLTNSPSSTAAQGAGGGATGAPLVIGNSLGSGGVAGGGIGTNWTVVVTGTNFPNLTLARNTHPGFDIGYAGTKVVFTNIFPASGGFPASFRLVNTGVGTFPMYAVLQKDGQPPVSIPGSFAAMTPFSAFYVSADAIAGQGGTTLAARNTITLLTPATTLLASKFQNEPSGDFVLSGPGL
jgi:hypothetical protein